MKKLLLVAILLIILTIMPSMAFAQGMMGTKSASSSDGHTSREEAEGKAIWEKLQAKQGECKNLTNDNFESLGEYFMGQMAGDSHEAMNNMMIRMMGEEGEKQVHIVMGKRLSGCDTTAQLPSQGYGFMPMMWMMGGGQQVPFNQTGSPMMWNWWGGFSSWLFQFTIVVWLIVGVLAAVWLFRQISKK